MGFLIKGLFGKTTWKIRFADPKMNRAMRFVGSCARRIRLLVHAGMLLHGQKIVQREFFLRRISTLSIYMFGILAKLAGLEANRKAGRSNHENLKILDYFVEEARQVRRVNFRLLPNRQEKNHHGIIGDIFGSHTAGVTAGREVRKQDEPVYATEKR
jgi:acyl-CoA dehydrogenase family protein 9